MNTVINIIRRFPSLDLKMVQKILSVLTSQRWLEYRIKGKISSRLRHLRKIDRILVVSDYNIGVSVNIQPAADALHYYFPEAQIDYVFNEKMGSLLKGSPSISRIFPVFSGNKLFSKDNLDRLMDIMEAKDYDLALNFCPFFGNRHFRNIKYPVLMPLNLLTFNILKALRDSGPAGLSWHVADYVNELAGRMPGGLRPSKPRFRFGQNRVYIGDDIMRRRDEFAESAGISEEDIMVYVNPDSSNKYTFVDPGYFRELIIRIIGNGRASRVILARCYSFKGNSLYIYNSLPESIRKCVALQPEECSLEFFAALVDICDIYIGCDTGPLHIAAAEKCVTGRPGAARNSTVLVNIFKATHAAIYGYDSISGKILDSFQSAPAKSFETFPPCKNITCSIQRIIENCDGEACSDSVRIKDIIRYVDTVLSCREISREDKLIS